MQTSNTNATYRIANDLTYRRWHVFPLHSRVGAKCSCGRADCDRPGNHPCTEAGPREATDDKLQLFRWWQDFPQADVAIALGPAGGLWSLEVVGPTGREALDRLEQQHGRLPRTTAVRVGERRLFLFRWPPGRLLASTTSLHGLPLGVLAEGRWVPVPGREGSGSAATWEVSPNHCDPDLAPDWLLDLVTEASEETSGTPVRGPETLADEPIRSLPPDQQTGGAADAHEAVSPAVRQHPEPSQPKIVMLPIADLVPHPATRQIPPMRDEEWQPLRESILKIGVVQPILVQVPNLMLDGCHRQQGGLERGDTLIPAILVDLSPEEQVDRIYEATLLRRHLNDDQRAVLAARWGKQQSRNAKQARARKAGRAGGRARKKPAADSSAPSGGAELSAVGPRSASRTPRTRERAAAAFHVSQKKVAKAEALDKEAPAWADKVLAGAMTLAQAKQALRRQAAPSAQASRKKQSTTAWSRHGASARLTVAWPPDPQVLAQDLYQGLGRESVIRTHAALGALISDGGSGPEVVTNEEE